MKFLLVIIALIGIQTIAFSKDRQKTVTIQSSVIDESVPSDKVKYSFIVVNSSIYNLTPVTYQLDKNGVNLSTQLDNNKTFTHETTAGAHKFVISVGFSFKEIKTRLRGKPGHHVIVLLNFKSKRQKRRRGRISVRPKKPIIYLYPEENMSVNVELDIKGSLTYSYPTYENGWSVEASPNGTITHESSEYNYLFWESNQSIEEGELDFTKGFLISGENITSFFEKSLTKFGFTSKEKADFITYWAPQMQDNPFLYICYMYNDACDKFAELSITPEPDVLARFYMLWSPVDENFEASSIEEQEIPTIDRTGFVVLEWGGMEINLNELKAIN